MPWSPWASGAPPVKTLRANCVESIAANMDSVWCKDFQKNLFNRTHCIHVVGPFDGLPAKLCHDIFVAMKKHRLKKHHVYLLVNALYTELDISGVDHELLPLILELAGFRCQQLQRLDLSGCTKIPKKGFLNSFPTWEKLTVLRLRHSATDDTLMSVVGVYAKLLADLDVSYTKVSDAGVVCLVRPVAEDGKPDDRFGQCRSLQRLDVRDSLVTNEGVRVVLDEIPGIAKLGFGDSLEVAFRILLDKPDTRFRLTTLDSTSTDVSDAAVAMVLNACPEVRQLHLATYEQMDNNSLLALVSRDVGLTELHITNYEEVNPISVLKAFTPVVACAHGHELMSLHLSVVSEINITLLIELCPELRHVFFEWNKSYTSAGPKEVKVHHSSYLAKLKTLKLLCSARTAEDEEAGRTPFPDEETVHKLLRAPMLREVHLSGCETLTDSTMAEVVGGHGFRCLQSLQLEECNRITMEPVRRMLVSPEYGPLRKLRLIQCRNVTLSEFQTAKKDMGTHASAVHIEWQ